jgi:hypothetical protein
MTAQRFARVELGAGSGVVAVAGPIALFVPDGDAAAPLVEIAREIAAGGPDAARPLARRLAGELTRGSRASHFGAVAADALGWVVLLHGDVAAAVVTADGSTMRLSGRDSVTWLDRILPAGVTTVTIWPEGGDPPASSPAGLEAGVVPAGWLRAHAAADADGDVAGAVDAQVVVVRPLSGATSVTGGPSLPPPPPGDRDATWATPVPVAAVDDDLPSGPVELFSLTPDGAAARPPLPIEGVLGTDDAGEDAGDTGVMSAAVTAHGGPPLGVLVFDDGATFALDGDYVLGREPGGDDAVRAGRARPIVLDASDGTVSRVHAEMRLVGGHVVLVDRRSTNGTHLWDAARGAWQQLTPDEPHIIQPGACAALGQRTFVYERPGDATR